MHLVYKPTNFTLRPTQNNMHAYLCCIQFAKIFPFTDILLHLIKRRTRFILNILFKYF